MRSIIKLLPSSADHPRLGVWIFGVAWLIGNMSLIIGSNGGSGELPAGVGFAIACASWWGGYRLGGTKSRVGTAVGWLVIGIWTLNLLGALLSAFSHYVADSFFWASVVMLFLLISAVLISNEIRRSSPA